jgi:phosphoglycerate dehydrogenase-like enzyme
MKVLVSIQQPVRAWQIPAESIGRLRERFPDFTFIHATDDEIRARGLRDCDIAYTWILSSDEVTAARNLKWVHTSAVAVETLALHDLFARGIIVSNSRGVQATPIAEHVFAVLLALAKQLPFILDRQREHHWAQNDVTGDRLPSLLRRRTMVLIGVGTIGSEIALLADAFGMDVIGLRRRPGHDTVPSVHEMLPFSELDAVLARADVLVIAAPLTPETTNMIGAAQLARMKRGALLVNVGRARIVDHVALTDALHSGHLGGASLDVFPREPLPTDDPLWSAPNLILTPHTSGFRQGHWDDVIDLFADNIDRFRRGDPVRFRVAPSLGY